jgi:2-methylisocitrate lyase-like PEP mutase family enzyme
MPTPAETLRALIENGDHFIAAEAYSAITGRIVESVGFKAAYMGGHACSAFHYAVPDNGVFSQVEMLDQATRIAHAMTIPLIVDADTLGETVADAYHFTRRYIRAGIAGYHVEDEVNPKHSKHLNGLCSIADMQARIDAGVRARKDCGTDLVIIARCDEMYSDQRGGGGKMDAAEAIRRGHAYAEAGADVIVYASCPPDLQPPLIKEMKIPVCTLGFNLPDTAFTLNTGWGWVGAAKYHLEGAKELMATGTIKRDLAFPEKYALIEQPFYDDLISEWAEKTGRKSRDHSAT